MSLHRRIALLVSVAVGIAVTVASISAWLIVREVLRNQVDEALLRQARLVASAPSLQPSTDPLATPNSTTPPGISAPLSHAEADRIAAIVLPSINMLSADGVVHSALGATIPVTDVDRQVAQGSRRDAIYDALVDGSHVRVAAVSAGGDRAVLLSRPLADVDATLRLTGWLLAVVSLLGVGVSAVLGQWFARVGVRPVHALAASVQHVAATQDTAAVIEVNGSDELASLAVEFNAMLRALETARARQRQLVDDASHELRTPLASLRTNLDLFERSERGMPLPETEREQLLVDVRTQTAELGELVTALVAVARDGESSEELSTFDVGALVERVVRRSRRHRPDVHVTASPESWTFRGSPLGIERAVSNVIDNAMKFSPPAGTVTVQFAGGVLTVRDEGPGIDPLDAPHILDRFYRSAAARSMPGSGLGLAIARDAVVAAGGELSIASTSAAGTVMRLTLPTLG